MRSIIDEIAKAEEQADEIRSKAVSETRELTAKAREEAEKALENVDAQERGKTDAALKEAQSQGEKLAGQMLSKMEDEANAICAGANAKIDDAVRYLVSKVQNQA